MDPICSTNAGVVSPKQTPATPAAGPLPAMVTDGQATATTGTGPFAGGPTTAGASDIPEPPSGPALGQDVLDRAFDTLERLEKEFKTLDPTTPEGSKRMMEINRQLNRVDEMIRMVNEMRRSRHEANMSIIDNIA